MKHVVIVAHPRLDSLTMSLARDYVSELARLGHAHTLYDLYRMAFHPTLSELDLAQAAVGTAAPEVLQAQQDIEMAHVVTVIYPLWWLSMPAILKGFIDRVFARGFAYESRHGAVRGLLSGKQCVMVTLSGSPLPVLSGAGRWDAVQMLQDTHVFQAVGFELLEHLHFDQVEPGLSEASVERRLSRIRECARAHFGNTANTAR